MPDATPALPTAPPGADRLASLDEQLWRRLLIHLRRSLAEVATTHGDAQARRLAAVPTTRLVSGRARRDVGAMLAAGGVLWLDLRRRVSADPDLAAQLGDALRAAAPPSVPPSPAHRSDRAAPSAAELQRLRERLREMRAQRDDARRRAEGETGRADREAAAREAAEQVVARLQARVEELEQANERAADERDAAVDRERRRGEAALSELTEQLRALRRDQHDQARRDRAVEQARAAKVPAPVTPAPPAAPRLVPGRPSRLPARTRPETTEVAQALLHAGRLVLIDGYNVTRTHRSDLDLEGQRRWLVNLVAGAVATRRIEATVVFDGHASPGQGSSRRDRGVTVVFTPEGVTADDDLVFEVEALEPSRPVVVVTDDRELRDRLAPYRVDLVPTAGFLHALR